MTQFNAPAYDIERPTGTCAFTGRMLEPGERYIATLVELDEAEQTADSDQPDNGQSGNDQPGNRQPDAAAALGFKRLDVAMDQWEQGNRPQRIFSHWISTIAQPSEKKRLFVDDSVLMNLFTRLADAEQPQRLAFRFVLALILMRKRLLRYDRTERRASAGPRQSAPKADVEGDRSETGEPPASSQTPAAEHASTTDEFWLVTPKLDISKGPLGKWNDAEQMEVLNPQLDDAQIQQVTEQLGEILEGEL